MCKSALAHAKLIAMTKIFISISGIVWLERNKIYFMEKYKKYRAINAHEIYTATACKEVSN